MKWIYPFLAVSSAFCANLTNDALFGLQQLRTVIPERQWEQEFSILVDAESYEKQAKKMMSRRTGDEFVPAAIAIAKSHDYFLNATMSGETIRILDWYTEFEEGVFWRTPKMMDRLKRLEE